METYLEIINDKLIRPATIRIEVQISFMSIVIEFENGDVVTKKINTEFILFMSSVKNLKFKPYDNDVDCAPEKLGFYDMFGYVVGDRISITSEDTFFNIILTS